MIFIQFCGYCGVGSLVLLSALLGCVLTMCSNVVFDGGNQYSYILGAIFRPLLEALELIHRGLSSGQHPTFGPI